MKNTIFTIGAILVVGVMSVTALSVLRDAPEVGGQSRLNTIESTATYSNDRFGYSLEYPRDIFTQISQSDNGDGVILKSSSEDITLRVYATNNTQGRTIADEQELSRASFSEVTDFMEGESVATLYGVAEDGRRRVDHMRVQNSDLFHVVLSYPEGEFPKEAVKQFLESFTINEQTRK